MAHENIVIQLLVKITIMNSKNRVRLLKFMLTNLILSTELKTVIKFPQNITLNRSHWSKTLKVSVHGL